MHPVHHPTVPPMTALDSSSGSSGASSSNGNTTISANDFLTLLVAEMKNQDPTADTDPNAYIDQLVQVNSLQQLIQINQDLGSSSTSSSSSSADSNVTSSNSSQASAASRLATSLEEKHTQSAVTGMTQASTAENNARSAPQSAQMFRTIIHRS